MFTFGAKKSYAPRKALIQNESMGSSLSEEDEDDDDVEYFDDLEMDGGVLAAVDLEGDAQEKALPQSPKQKRARKKKGQAYRKVDVNVFTLNLGTLASNANLSTGDPTICGKCGAYFNCYSKITSAPASTLPPQPSSSSSASSSSSSSSSAPSSSSSDPSDITDVWKCEFCAHVNEIFLDEEEKPKV